jgi:hypothetical protein
LKQFAEERILVLERLDSRARAGRPQADVHGQRAPLRPEEGVQDLIVAIVLTDPINRGRLFHVLVCGERYHGGVVDAPGGRE